MWVAFDLLHIKFIDLFFSHTASSNNKKECLPAREISTFRCDFDKYIKIIKEKDLTNWFISLIERDIY